VALRIGKPLVAGLGRGLYEVRTAFRGGSYRVMFCIQGGTMVLLHGFKKKTPATPAGEMTLARDRQRDVEQAR
jgi:phage-related protein